METVSQYEVVCRRCNVTFPVGTKVCIHCGGGTSASHVQVPESPPHGHDMAEPVPIPVPIDVFEEEEEAPAKGSSKLRSLVTLVWILLAVGFSVVRACNEGG